MARLQSPATVPQLSINNNPNPSSSTTKLIQITEEDILSYLLYNPHDEIKDLEKLKESKSSTNEIMQKDSIILEAVKQNKISKRIVRGRAGINKYNKFRWL